MTVATSSAAINGPASWSRYAIGDPGNPVSRCVNVLFIPRRFEVETSDIIKAENHLGVGQGVLLENSHPAVVASIFGRDERRDVGFENIRIDRRVVSPATDDELDCRESDQSW